MTTNQALATTFSTEQIATDFAFGDYQNRVTLPDGTLAYVEEDPYGSPAAYRKRVCCDYGGNVLAERRADESCLGISDFGSLPTTVSCRSRVSSVKLTYVRSAGDCTGRQIYRVEAV